MKTKITTVLLLLIVAFSTSLFAQTTWTGNNSGNWNDSQNWTAGVPDGNTDAIISFPATGNWAIISSASFCKSIHIESGSYLGMNTSASIEVKGDFTNEGTFDGGDGTVIFAGNSTISGYCSFNNIHITGTFNAPESMQVNGNFVNDGIFNAASGIIKFLGNTLISGAQISTFYSIENYASLTGDVTLMNVQGQWLNNGTFFPNGGIVKFNGNTNQNIGLISETEFSNLIIDNPSAGVSLTGNAKVQGYVNLKNGYLNLFTNTLSIENPMPEAITRINGYIISESLPSIGIGFINWNIGSRTGTYSYPFGNAEGTSFIPVSVEITTAGVGNGVLSLATYHTNSFNEPYPGGVTNVNDSAGNDNSDKAVDRFWIAKVDGYTVKPISNIIFKSNDDEVGLNHNLISKKWNGIEWVSASTSQQAGTNNVSVFDVQEYTVYSLFDGGDRKDDDQNNPPTNPDSTKATTGISQVGSAANTISIFPNLINNVSTIIHINGLDGNHAGLRVIDMNGEEVFKSDLSSISSNIDFSLEGKTLPNGIYYVAINDGKSTSVKTLTFIQ